MDFKAPYLTYDSIRHEAKKFLNQYSPEDRLFLDIEYIVEYDLEIDIIPLPGLRKNYSTDAYLSKDLKSIYVDQIYFDQKNYYFRYRYTLAHEIAHFILHRNFYEQVEYRDTTEWIHILKSIPKNQYSFFEKHANDFAGLILVSDSSLEKCFRETIENKLSGYNIETFNKDVLLEWICNWIGQEYYKVSSQVIEKRLKYNGLHL